MRKEIDPDLEREIIELYKSGQSMAKIGARYDMSSAFIMSVLDRNNVPKRTKGGIYPIQQADVISRYQNGESCQDIAMSYAVTFNTISKILEDNNVARDNRYDNKSLDLDYFENIDRPDKAYFLGLALTDANVSEKGNIIRLSLSSKDEEILHVFSDKCGNSNSIVVREDGKHSERTFQLRCKKWKTDLAKYGVVPRKTFTCTMPMLRDDMMPHLIRGMIDGDGWISSLSHKLGFCGNQKTVTQVHDHLVNTLGVYNVKVLHTETNLWQTTWASRRDIEKICEYMYADKGDCYIKRKFDNYQVIIHGNTEVTS